MIFTRFRGLISRDFGVFLAFLSTVLLMGGGSRADITPLIVLRPLAVLVCVYAILRMPRERTRANWALLVFAGLLLAYVLVQLVPLPPSIWQRLPGREIVVETDRLAGIRDHWRPMTLSPIAGWNAFYSMSVPLAVLLLGLQLNREDRFRLLYVMLTFGAITALIGILQILGPPTGALYFYRITNNGLSVGLFANRNHQAVYLACLIPMLAVAASLPGKNPARTRLRLWLATLSVIFLGPLIIATASRAGLIVGVFGVASLPFLFSLPPELRSKAKKESNPLRRASAIFGAVVVALMVLVPVAIVLMRSPAYQRLLETQSDEARNTIWATTYDSIGGYLPWGSGVGSFVEVFQIKEPVELLGPTYVNHAHNDFLELLLTGGLIAAALLAAAALWFMATAAAAWRQPGSSRELRFARMASVVIAMLAAASVVDYPLRTPSMAVFFVIAALWLRGNRIDGERQKGFSIAAASASAAAA